MVYTKYPKQSSLPYLEIPFRPGGYLDAVVLINQNKTKALATMNQLSAIGAHPKGFSSFLGTRFYSHIVRAQLEYGLAIIKSIIFLSKQLEDAQNVCLRRIFGGTHTSFTTKMLYYIFFYLFASLEVTPNGTSSIGLPFGRDVPPTQNPWIVALYDRNNENTAKTTSTINVLRISPFFLRTVAQLSLSTLSYDYLCPSLKEVAAYVGVLAGFLVVDTKPVPDTLINPLQKSIPYTVSRCTVDS
ncbi:uncharacterized protein RHIMIDRAFT_240646 [Rhizopus microsporus ATCC 52813]|uniref:Uncharacterized protein n=1 Tax=Rhizopus microsporus ATCC 52813 TaxID=1340429 RepID=A0A2G4SL85_RHIZD|nr:uncharacterized protein RHIMIDRAFT_240646 [Rhizopus microsporus ATCC 52813]PHZ09524.1 hypothetical protein RHIMIDRAFT_240646 [Rhizopus microsporus ATCC 52813]